MNYSYGPMSVNNVPYDYGKYAGMQAIPMPISCVDPYLVSALMPMIGKKLVVETVRGSITGMLIDVKPDHIVIGEPQGDSKFYIRTAEIVHIMPIDNDSCCPKYK
jgi:hypothetical protein